VEARWALLAAAVMTAGCGQPSTTPLARELAAMEAGQRKLDLLIARQQIEVCIAASPSLPDPVTCLNAVLDFARAAAWPGP
jgi:hypothetical protein